MTTRRWVLVLALAGGLLISCMGVSFGQPNQDPCGGRYAGEGLKATFLSQYYDLAVDENDPFYPNVRLWNSCFTNGNASSYQYMRGGDCVFLYRNGHVIVGVGWPLTDMSINHDRYVNMRFDWKQAGACDPLTDLAPFMTGGGDVPSAAIQFWTGNGFAPTRRPDGKLLLTSTNALLNFGALTPGATYYFQLMVRFNVAADDEEYRFDTQFKVYYGPFDDGGFGWEISPIHEPYEVQMVTKVGKKLVPNGDPTPHESSVYHQELVSQPSNGCYGHFYFPFKLRLERLQ